jgi:predicted RNA binding protein YcfA (HicA-like mRNA interferase family)
MKRFRELSKILKEDFDAKEVEVANKTSRSAGAVSGKALVPRHIEQHGNKEHEHLDFGAGKDAVHAKHLREKGFKVTAHEFGSNQKEGVHDPKALHKKYDHVYASNVLNVQSSHHMLKKTLDQIHKATKPGGHFTGNLPESPRKFHELNHDLVHHELKKRFHDVKVVGGTKKAPVYHATGPKEKIDEQYSGESAAARTLKEKPNKEPMKKLSDPVKEEVEQLDEISDEAMGKYKEKAKVSADELESKKKYGKALLRRTGILRATSKMVGRAGQKIEKLAKEEVESLDEVNYAGWSFDDLHKHLKKSGWDRDRNSKHIQYVHPKSSRPIAVPHKHGKTVAPGTVRNIHQKMKEFVMTESRKAEIVKEIVKKKKNEKNNTDSFQKDPVLSSEITKA